MQFQIFLKNLLKKGENSIFSPLVLVPRCGTKHTYH